MRMAWHCIELRLAVSRWKDSWSEIVARTMDGQTQQPDVFVYDKLIWKIFVACCVVVVVLCFFFPHLSYPSYSYIYYWICCSWWYVNAVRLARFNLRFLRDEIRFGHHAVRCTHVNATTKCSSVNGNQDGIAKHKWMKVRQIEARICTHTELPPSICSYIV